MDESRVAILECYMSRTSHMRNFFSIWIAGVQRRTECFRLNTNSLEDTMKKERQYLSAIIVMIKI